MCVYTHTHNLYSINLTESKSHDFPHTLGFKSYCHKHQQDMCYDEMELRVHNLRTITSSIVKTIGTAYVIT